MLEHRLVATPLGSRATQISQQVLLEERRRESGRITVMRVVASEARVVFDESVAAKIGEIEHFDSVRPGHAQLGDRNLRKLRADDRTVPDCP